MTTHIKLLPRVFRSISRGYLVVKAANASRRVTVITPQLRVVGQV